MPYQIASIEGLMHGLYLLWWVQERHMSPAVVAATLAAGDLAILLLEIPTGWFADRYGHRLSLIVGSATQVFGMLACWLGQGVPGLVVASVLVALGDCFRSGADQALLYRSCVALGREREFQIIEARTQAARLAGLAGLVVAGGAIVAAWGFAAGWIAEVALSFVGLLIACAMREPPASVACEREYGEGEAAASNAPARPRRIIALIVPAAAIGAGASMASFLAQTTGHGEPGAMTLLVAGVTLAEAAGAMAAVRWTSAGARALYGLAAAGAVCVALAIVQPSAFIPAVLALSWLQGLAHPLRASAIQRAIPDGMRARAASLASACDMGLNTIALPLAGLWQSRRR